MVTPASAIWLQEHAGNATTVRVARQTGTTATKTPGGDGGSDASWGDVDERITALKSLTDVLRGTVEGQAATSSLPPDATRARTSALQACTAIDNRLDQLGTAFALQMRKRPGKRPNREHRAAIREAGEGLMPLFGQMVRGCMDLSRAARAAGDHELAAEYAEIADGAAQYQAPVAPPGADGAAPSHGKETAAGMGGYIDTLQTGTLGVGGGIIGAVEASGTAVGPAVASSAGLASGATAVGAVVGAAGGSLGMVFGSVSTFLGFKALHRGRVSANELVAVGSKVTDADVAALTGYARKQKTKKKWRGLATAGGGVVAAAAGIVGLIALTIATAGVAAVVLGLGAAAIGIGFVAYKYFHKKAKRRKERDAIAAGLVAEADPTQQPDPQKQQEAWLRLRVLGFSVGDGIPSYSDVRDRLKERGMGQRDMAAGALLGHLVSGSPSQQLQAEAVLEALHVDPARLRRLRPDAAQSEISRKLASW